MLMMVTSRRRRGDGYGHEEQRHYGYDFLFDHRDDPPGQDGFAGRGKAGFRASLWQELVRLRDEEGINTPKVGIYLHGYNNDWQESIDELVDIHRWLSVPVGYRPVIIGFSWPSSGRGPAYLSDREEVRDSVPAFCRFLRDVHGYLVENERRCFTTTFCIAHSMGNYLLRKGMEYLSDHLGTPVGRAMFNETVMLAPDLASKDIEQDGKGIYIAQFSRRVHVYYSKHDRALKLSSRKRFGANRLGRHGANDYGNLPANVVLVNAEAFATKDATAELEDRRGNRVSVHSSHRYHPDILRDVTEVISSVERDLIPNRQPIPSGPAGGEDLRNHYRLTEQA